ncbi:MAG: hypothetical protein D3906_00250 [Candidatus Electrothrix sp. AUS1_2]|nr:hypothetical protein [Candidatus Electrothrix sp. AUS1_2]
MAKDDEKDRRARIEKLQRKIEELTGEKPVAFGSGNCSPELKEKFWEYVFAFEEGKHASLFDTLVNGGLLLPAPEELDDRALTEKLWEIIYALAMLGVFLHNTDHLNDRELYADLWQDLLREEYFLQPANRDFACHLDIIGSGSEEDLFLFLKYYADEKERTWWKDEYPQDDFPASEPRPYDRDRLLPKREEWEEGQC